MACCQHPVRKRPPERMGWVAAIRRQLHTWQRTAWEEKGSERTPHRSVREDEMVTQTMGSTQACVRLASVWECLGKHSFLPPFHYSSRTKHTVALLGTHGTSAAASGRADSWQLRFVFASWESWHCHFINYLWLLQGKKERNELFWGCSCKVDIHPRDSQQTYDSHKEWKPPT